MRYGYCSLDSIILFLILKDFPVNGKITGKSLNFSNYTVFLHRYSLGFRQNSRNNNRELSGNWWNITQKSCCQRRI